MQRLGAAAVAVLTAVLGGAACGTSEEANDQGVGPTATAPASLTVGRGDLSVTRRVCSHAASATLASSRLVNDQLAELEKAAAAGDQVGLVAAAGAINDELTALAGSLSTMAQESVVPAVRSVLIDGSAALAEISSVGYQGSTADITERLAELTTVLRGACR